MAFMHALGFICVSKRSSAFQSYQIVFKESGSAKKKTPNDKGASTEAIWQFAKILFDC